MILGVSCDGNIRDFNHALIVIREFEPEYAELQYLGEKEVGDHNAQESTGCQ